jgi:hypothetical protein
MERTSDLPARLQAEEGRLGPTRIVLLLTAAALALALGTSAGVLTAIERSRASVERVADELERPMDHLLAAERANEAAQAALSAAVGSSGVERTTALSDAVQLSEDASSEWARFRAAKADLPGEAALLERFTAADRLSRQAASALLVPILNTDGTATLPRSQVASHEAVMDVLIDLHTLYQRARRATLADLRRHTRNFETVVSVGSGAALLILLVGGAISMRTARRIRRRRVRLRGG